MYRICIVGRHRWPIWPLNVYEHYLCSTQNVLPTHPIADLTKWHPVTAASSKIRISRWCVALFIWPAWGYSWYCDLQSKMTSHLSHPTSSTQWWRRDRINITTNLNSRKGRIEAHSRHWFLQWWISRGKVLCVPGSGVFLYLILMAVIWKHMHQKHMCRIKWKNEILLASFTIDYGC